MGTRVGTLVLAALAAAIAAGCGREDRSAGPPPRHVLLVSIDTLRADALACYGNAEARTETFDRLAGEGVRFQAAIAPSPVTLPSHASMLTGLDPWTLGILDNGIYRLAPEFDSLAEILAAEGFETAAFIGGYPLTADSGLDQGFARYDDAIPMRERARYHNPERSAEEVTDAALVWIESRAEPSRSSFIFVHYYDVHAPYQPPARYVSSTATAGAEETFVDYPGEVAYVDDQLGRLLDALRESGALDDTLVVVTADHGEGLMDHGELTHSIFLYDEVVRVPLILRFPPALPAGREIDEVVGIVDIAPTILDALGLPTPRIDGRSLWRLARGGDDGPRTAVFSESQVGRLSYGWSGLRSIRTVEWKYVDAPEPELYSLADDAEERVNVAEDHPGTVESLQRRIEEAFREAASAEAVEISQEEIDRLRSLGYLQGMAEGPATDADDSIRGPDPKAMISQYIQLQLAAGEMSEGRYFKAESRLEELAARDPANVTARCRLADARIAQGDYPAARQTLREALAVARGRGRAPVIWRMAGLERRSGNHDRAMAYYREYTEMTAPSGRTVEQMALTMKEAGKPGEAESLLRDWIEERPSSLIGLRSLARLLDETGREHEADELWSTILEIRPHDEEAASAASRR